jgi:membrane-associated phospholipid phosphatase
LALTILPRVRREERPSLRLLGQSVLASLRLALLPAAAFALIAVLDLLPPTARWNERVSVVAQGPEEAPLTLVGFFTDWLFSAKVLLPTLALACLLLLVRRRWRTAFSLGLIFPLVVVELLLKLLIHQPPASHYLNVRLMFATSNPGIEVLEHGFPSGHAARIGFVLLWLALVLVPARSHPRAVFAAVLLILFSAWTRIYVGDHSVLEVIAGLLLAAVFLPASWLLLSRRPAR